jgi:hypothetical protein
MLKAFRFSPVRRLMKVARYAALSELASDRRVPDPSPALVGRLRKFDDTSIS